MKVDTKLIQGCLENRRAAQNELYKQLFSSLMNICVRYCRDYDSAGEALNSIFLKVLNNLDRYNEAHSFYFWMRRIAINHMIDIYRKEQRKMSRTVYMEDMTHEGETAVYDMEADRFESEYLLQMIRSLPPVTAKVFNLFAIDGYKHQEIAEMLNMSENTSKWHLHEARKKLKIMVEVFNQSA